MSIHYSKVNAIIIFPYPKNKVNMTWVRFQLAEGFPTKWSSIISSEMGGLQMKKEKKKSECTYQGEKRKMLYLNDAGKFFHMSTKAWVTSFDFIR